jgi:hypothetical protein
MNALVIWNRRSALLFLFLPLTFLLILLWICVEKAVQIGADEGFELAKATLSLTGHKLYSEVERGQERGRPLAPESSGEKF